MFNNNKNADILEDNDLSDDDLGFDKKASDDRSTDNSKKAPVKDEPSDVIEDLEETNLSDKLGTPVAAITADGGSGLMKYVTNVLAILGLLFTLFFVWSFINGSGDSKDGDDSASIEEITDESDVEDRQPVDDTELAVNEEQALTEEQIAEYLNFEQIGDDEFKVTGRVTSLFDDRAADGNAGIIVEGEYRISTAFGFVEAGSVTVGDVDEVATGDWVEVYAQGRKSFSNTASYLLDVFASKYSVVKIDNPLPETAPASSNDDTSATNEDEDSDGNDSATSSNKVNDVTVKRGAVDAWDLKVDLEYAGCSSHDFGLNLTNASEDTIPKIKVEVTHDANGDDCEELSSSTETLDLEPILASLEYPRAYDLEISGSDNTLRSFRVQ